MHLQLSILNLKRILPIHLQLNVIVLFISAGVLLSVKAWFYIIGDFWKSFLTNFKNRKFHKSEALRPVPMPKFSKIWLYCPQICAWDTLEYVFRWFRTFLKILSFRIFPVSLCVKSRHRLRAAKFWTPYFTF